MSFPKYPEYKDSGVEWLGEVPAHWEVKPLKHVATYNDDVLAESTPDNFEIKYVEISDVDEHRGVVGWSVHTFASAPSRARRVLRHGDVLISTVRTYLRAIAPVIQPPANLIGSTGFAVIRPGSTELRSGLLGYALRAEGFISEVISRSVGVSYPAINASDLVSIGVPVPPLAEQLEITSFLGHQTAKIDKLIEEQRRLIELLKEKRQAVISHAVTKGLDPNVPMKDSGVEWLGEVPAHWDVSRLGWVARTGSGYPFPAELFGFDGIPVIRMSDMKLGKISTESIKRVPEESVPCSAFAEIGDLLIGLSGSISNFAVIGSDDLPVAINQRVGVIRGSDGAGFLAYYIQSDSFLEEIASELEETTIQNISMGQMRSCRLIWPPQLERDQVVRFLNQENSKIGALISEVEKAISVMEERRSALISAAVTGKIDVRGGAEGEESGLAMVAEESDRYSAQGGEA